MPCMPIATTRGINIHTQMDITARSSKDDIITSALEITDTQQGRIRQLEAQQRILFVGFALLSLFLLF